MANVLTDLAADIYVARDRVASEVTGFIGSSTVNAGPEGAAVGQTVRSHFTRSVSTASITPSMTIPEGTDQTVDNKTLTLTKQKHVPIPWTGEDVRFVNGGPGYETIYGDQIEQAFRAIRNEVEADLATEAYQNASRAFGTAGTTPFGSDFDAVAEVREILLRNGAPVSDGRLSLVLSPGAGTKLRNQAQLQKVNEAGDGGSLLRRGELLNLQGMSLKESLQVQSHTKGTSASHQTTAAFAIGDTAITVDTGSGTILAGDVVTFAGDSNKYVVAEALSGGTFTLAEPGLRAAVADNTAITVGASYTANVALHQSALELAMRAPADPFGGDAAVDQMIVQDPFTGLSFSISVYKGFHKAMISVGAVWGFKAWKPENIAALLG